MIHEKSKVPGSDKIALSQQFLCFSWWVTYNSGFFFCNLWHIYPDGVTVQRELCITDTHTDSEGRVSCALTSLALSDISVRLKPENGRAVKTRAVSHGLTYTGLQSYEPRREVSDDKTKVRFFFFFFSFAVPNNKREAGHRLVWAGGCGIWELS